MVLRPKDLSKMIDNTLLDATASVDEIKELCQGAREYQFAAVCVNPIFVSLCHRLLEDTSVKVCTVVGFPLGANTIETKAYEACMAIKNGARELDMVINLGAIKSKAYQLAREDIKAVVEAPNALGINSEVITKVIIETCYLSEEEIKRACLLVQEAGADFVKTSTGLGPAGAREEDIILIRQVIGREIGVKAAGGIRSFDDAARMVNAGANRIGTSSGLQLVTGKNA